MEITWQAHHAVISERLKARAEAAVTKVARRLNRAVGATIRFERESTRCRVEVMLRAPRRKTLVSEGHGRYYGPALAVAVAHLTRQVAGERRTAKERAARGKRS